MKQVREHTWNPSSVEAMQLQESYSRLVEREDRLATRVRHVAGVDVAYGKESNSQIFAVVVVLDLDSMQTIESRTAIGKYQAEYVPGLFAFRELPTLCEAMERIERAPDLIICDGQGIAHPRRCGIASHLGILFDVPTIGCGKTRLIGTFDKLGPVRGDWEKLTEGAEVVGSVLRTQNEINPLFISIGHRVSLVTARNWILRLATEYRQPEPIRRANQLANELRESHRKQDLT